MLSPDGRTLGLIVAPSTTDLRPGSVSYVATARETVSTVTISVAAVPQTGRGAGMAIGLGATRTLDVTLAAPLGSRAVLDAATGRTVAAAP